MELTAGIPTRPDLLASALEGWIAVSRKQLREHPDWPPLYQSGVRYQREPRGRERWQTVEETRRVGHGDCEDLVIARVAELREAGEAGAAPHVYRTARSTWHTVVRRADGTIEDPSRVLGMGADMAGTDPSRAKVEITDIDAGKRASLRWRGEGYQIAVSADAVDATAATAKAAAIARQVYDGLAKQAAASSVPGAIQALLPPQAAAAIKVAGALARLAQSGKLQQVAGKLRGPARRLASLLRR